MGTQDAVYEMDESKTGAVIQDIAQNVLHEPELDISDQLSELETKHQIKPNEKYQAAVKKYARISLSIPMTLKKFFSEKNLGF